VRNWNVSAFFPEVKPAHEAQQSCTVSACRLTTAAQRGLEDLLSRAALKGKHISTARVTIVAAGKEQRER
jgi:hypothetical protein